MIIPGNYVILTINIVITISNVTDSLVGFEMISIEWNWAFIRIRIK